MPKHTLLKSGGIVAAACIAFGVYAWHPAVTPIDPPAKAQFSAEQIAKGKTLAAAGYCSSCHTAPEGQPFAGNYEMHTQFGVIYSSNITPDVKTGIGNWSEQAFARAMRSGISRDGHHLLPAFPYEHFNKLSDEDIAALYAYIMSSVEPVEQEKRANGIPFPLNLRFLQAGWKLLFADINHFVAQTDKSDEWNRGAYLAEGIAHCGACHTPRNALGGEQYDRMYQGAPIDGWIAPSLTSTSTAPIAWRQQDLYEYLRTGNSAYHGSALGPMAPVVHQGLSALSDADVKAISVYLTDKGDLSTDSAVNTDVVAKQIATQQNLADPRIDNGVRLYQTACSSCHYSSEELTKGRPLLVLGTATHLAEPTNLINVNLDGPPRNQGIEGVVMPAFRDALNDDDIADIAAYLRQSAGEKPWPNLVEKVGEIRRQPRFEQ